MSIIFHCLICFDVNEFSSPPPDIPELPSLTPDEKEEEEDVQVEKKSSPVRHPSGPRSPNPYDTEDSSKMLPIFIAIGAFLPLLFCLCRL